VNINILFFIFVLIKDWPETEINLYLKQEKKNLKVLKKVGIKENVIEGLSRFC